MGTPLGPTLANAFLCHYEKQWLDNCLIHFKPMIYKKYVDDIFVLSSSKEHLQLFVDFMSKQHKCITFTSEIEHGNSFSFLDIEITRHNQQFKTFVYRKSALVYLRMKVIWVNHIKSHYLTLYYLLLSIYSDYTLFDLEVENLREILKRTAIHHEL